MEKNSGILKIIFSPALNECDLGQFAAKLFLYLRKLTDRIIQKKQLLRVKKKRRKNCLQILILILNEVLIWHLLCSWIRLYVAFGENPVVRFFHVANLSAALNPGKYLSSIFFPFLSVACSSFHSWQRMTQFLALRLAYFVHALLHVANLPFDSRSQWQSAA